jgi:hypothetical protein
MVMAAYSPRVKASGASVVSCSSTAQPPAGSTARFMPMASAKSRSASDKDFARTLRTRSSSDAWQQTLQSLSSGEVSLYNRSK